MIKHHHNQSFNNDQYTGKTHQTLHGIEIDDCGHKVGLNGVANGALKFGSVSIPRHNLLNSSGDVSRDGQHTSTIPSVNKRFSVTLRELVGCKESLAYSLYEPEQLSLSLGITNLSWGAPFPSKSENRYDLNKNLNPNINPARLVSSKSKLNHAMPNVNSTSKQHRLTASRELDSSTSWPTVEQYSLQSTWNCGHPYNHA
ncbi:hypothetical protein KIW84_075129 [Lathyrus oleraceus]|uniref:Uncharacterized protein n=1 Tax=Pisum sativum TaxID=3888 RepID=A0A9D4VSY3_PEA|nr:hypothetical protein KIW84_075129 [Pisum sativum]